MRFQLNDTGAPVVCCLRSLTLQRIRKRNMTGADVVCREIFSRTRRVQRHRRRCARVIRVNDTIGHWGGGAGHWEGVRGIGEGVRGIGKGWGVSDEIVRPFVASFCCSSFLRSFICSHSIVPLRPFSWVSF